MYPDAQFPQRLGQYFTDVAPAALWSVTPRGPDQVIFYSVLILTTVVAVVVARQGRRH